MGRCRRRCAKRGSASFLCQIYGRKRKGRGAAVKIWSVCVGVGNVGRRSRRGDICGKELYG